MRNKIAASKTIEPLLITGNTGVGKTYLAKEIHSLGRANKNFIHVNCASFSKNLIESELFGHTQGAFTGALKNKVGFCEVVGDGTLFLDEFAELSLETQAKLLTLIDERCFYKVGDTAVKKFKGRFIFATNKNLEKEVAAGKFREDLYYRIRYFHISLKDIKQRSDFQSIFWQMVNSLKVEFEQSVVFNEKSLNKLLLYSWPGNYRELKNTLKYLFLLGKEIISEDDLPEWICEISKSEGLSHNYYKHLFEFERNYFEMMMRSVGGRVNKCAKLAGISKVTLISKLKKYDIDKAYYQNFESLEKADGF